jgi:radical SAM protein with 4Fe4S-binding SPASM domain
VETLPYADFSLTMHRKSLTHRAPLCGAIEVTHRCPQRCVHCYNNLEMGDKRASLMELDCDEHCRILDEIVDTGCLWLLYTGGEIFARSDFLDIYTYAKQKGLLITLFTSGLLIDEKIADHLVQWRPFSVEITLYGRTKSTHERVTRVAGSYERSMRAIRLLKERSLPLRLKTIVMTLNRHELWDLKRFVEEDLGLNFRFDAMINPRTDCSLAPLSFRLSPHQIVDLDLQDPSRMAEWQKFAEECSGPVHPPDKHDELFHCGAGINAFDVDPYGRLRLCGLLPDAAWDLRYGSFAEGWEDCLTEARRAKITRLTKCTDCEIKALCGMCPANGTLENNDAEEPVDFLCHVAHVRAKALGISMASHPLCHYCETA